MRCEATIDMFSKAPPSRMKVARERGETAALAAEARAVRADDAFREKARGFILEYLKRHGPTPGEKITDAMVSAGITAPDDRAFGAAYGCLSRRHQIRCVGFCAREKGNGTAGGRIWSLT